MSLTSNQRELIELLFSTLPIVPAEIAQKNVEWYKQWVKNESLSIGDRRWSLVNDEKILYEVYSEAGDNLYPPEQVPAIFKQVFTDEYPEWVQPIGAGTQYSKGDKVTHNGKKWVSTADNNVWEPGIYGWDEITK